MAAEHHRLIIVGSGPAGYTAAVYAARAALEPVLITGVEVGGQMTTTTDVDNWPGDDKGIQGPDLMERMKRHAERFGTKLIYNHVDRVELGTRPFHLHCGRSEYTCDALIVATGASAKYLGLPTEEAFKGRGVSACATCDGFFFKGQTVAVVGGGNTAVEEALYLSNIASRVTVVHRRDEFRAEQIMINKLTEARAHGNVEILWNHVLDEVVGDERGVTGARLKHTKRSRAARDRGARRLHRDRAHAEHEDLRRPARDGRRLHRQVARGAKASRPRRASRACSRPATSPTRSIARRSRPRARAAWPRSTPRRTSKDTDPALPSTGRDIRHRDSVTHRRTHRATSWPSSPNSGNSSTKRV